MSLSSRLLSQVINERAEVSFPDFINKYRIEEAKRLLTNNHNNWKILVIGLEVGFSNKTSFHRYFKKYVNLTPSEFQNSL